MGTCTITAAELKGAIEGLRIAWDKGHMKVQLHLDSMTTISIMKTSEDDSHRHGFLSQQFRQLLNRNWGISISHVHRECNFAADYLAGKGHGATFGTHLFDVSDPGLNRWITYDVMGIAQTRSISYVN
ncbi:unnamed protein product [Linum tenue]|uniref:RNase H type-1 domain-containing protein n=1 Tax=Linum tenue TaxID=586396 RepID=A0AAV0MZV7_9ROSI|nr:unnamed protein product [Linum tenue]